MCVAACCSVSQCVAVRCSVLQCVAVRCSVLQCVAVCCSVLQCVAVCCSVLPCVAVSYSEATRRDSTLLPTREPTICVCSFGGCCGCCRCELDAAGLSPVHPATRQIVLCVAVCCSVLQCVAVCCSVLQCVAVRCCFLIHMCHITALSVMQQLHIISANTLFA